MANLVRSECPITFRIDIVCLGYYDNLRKWVLRQHQGLVPYKTKEKFV